jgi:hypothetical protein
MTDQLPRSAGIYFRKADDWDRKGWTSVPNRLVRDPRLPWDSKGAYAWIASHQQLVYKLSAEELSGAGPRGRDHAYGMLRALEEGGWLTRQRYQADDGRGTVQLWTLHGEPVPESERTYRPSSARPRPKRIGASSQVRPQLLDVQEFPTTPDVTPSDREDVSAGQPGTPDRPGVPGTPDRPGTDRSGTDRSGLPIEKEEKTKREDSGVTYAANVQTAHARDRDDHNPPPRRREPAAAPTGHAARPVPPVDYAARACRMCRLDVDGHTRIRVLADVEGRPVFTPLTVCDHVTPLDDIRRELDFLEQHAAAAAAAAAPQPIQVLAPNHGPRRPRTEFNRGTPDERARARAELAAARAREEGGSLDSGAMDGSAPMKTGS